MPDTALPATTAPPHDPVRAAVCDDAIQERIRRHARASLRGRTDDIEEVVSDVRARAMEISRRYDPARGTVAQWLSGITDFVLKERHRKAQRGATSDLAGHEPAVESDAGRELDVSEARSSAERLLSQLPPVDLAIVRYRIWEDLDFAAIAAKLNLSPVNARQRYRRALNLMAELDTQEGRS